MDAPREFVVLPIGKQLRRDDHACAGPAMEGYRRWCPMMHPESATDGAGLTREPLAGKADIRESIDLPLPPGRSQGRYCWPCSR